jgi:hypothetical protein
VILFSNCRNKNHPRIIDEKRFLIFVTGQTEGSPRIKTALVKIYMKNKFNWLRSSLLLFGLVGLFASAAFAQQTIVNVPSADVLGKGEFYLEFDSTFKFDKNTNNDLNRFSSFVPRVVAGVGKNVEVGLNLTGNIQPGSDATTLMPTVKIKFYDKKGWALVGGDHVYIPVRNRSYNVGNYVYLQASKSFKSNTRVTFGAYHTSKNVFAPKAQRAGGQFGFEQTINSKFSVGADWITGKHAAGYLTPVFTIKPVSRTSVYLGYSIGNSGVTRGNHFFYAAVGFSLTKPAPAVAQQEQ